MLRDSGFFGRILSVRGEFDYWVFEGDWRDRRQATPAFGVVVDALRYRR